MSGQAGQQVFGLPRLQGRLTAELILRSPQEMNAIKEYQIDLRGNKISAIENLGATQNQFDCIDLSDNEIVKVEGFPALPRLRTLLLNNNRIARIADELSGIPNLETLVLTGNRLSNLADLDNLSCLPKLIRLSLLDNVVTKKENYRLYVIHRLPNLKLLDFTKVKQKEREAARVRFGESPTVGEGTKGNGKVEDKPKTFVVGAMPAPTTPAESPAAEKKAAAGPTPEQLTAIKAAIANATTLEEVARLEKALKSGQVAAEILGADPEEMEEG